MSLELLHRDDQPQRDQRIDEALGQQRHDDGQEAGDHRTDQRNERAQEHQRGQRQCQWHPHDRQAGADADRVDQRDEEGRAHVADQRSEAGLSCRANLLPHVGREDPRDELVDVAAAVEKEDEREQHDERAGHDLGDGARGGQRAGGQLLLVVPQRIDRGLARAVDLLLVEMRRAVDEPTRRLVDAVLDLVDETGQALDELADNESQDSSDHRQPQQQQQEHRGASGNAVPIQPIHARQQQRREHQRECHRHEDHLEVLEHPQRREHDPEHREHPPRPRRALAHQRRDGEVFGCWHSGSVTAALPQETGDAAGRKVSVGPHLHPHRASHDSGGTCTVNL